MLLLKHVLNNETRDIPLTGKTFHIGRLGENDIVLSNTRSPDIAAELTYIGEELHIAALQSGFIKVNGKKCKSSALLPGDRIEIDTDIFIIDRTDGTTKLSIRTGSKTENILDKFTHFAEIIGKERDLNKLLNTIIDILLETIGGNDAFILKLNSEGKPQLFASSNVYSSEDHFSDTIVQQALKQGKGIFIRNALDNPELAASRSIADLQLTSVLCSPIKVADKVIGVIYLGAKKRSLSYKESDLKILNTYAVIAGTLINHVEYISQQRDAIKRLTEFKTPHEGIIAESKAMQDIIESVDSIADSDIGILLEGETGTGKDLIAKLIHKKGSRSGKQMIVINCSSIQKDLQESELFGHVRGSFTGAVSDRQGLFTAANGGTLFLDEIGDMDISLQAKFLRALETGKIRPVGSAYEDDVDVRVICATNKDLEEMVENRTFRKDLYFRINQFRYTLPPLRNRGEDCIHLAYYFLEKYKAEYPNRKIVDFHPSAIEFIRSYSWPGNVRELATLVHKIVLSSQTPLGMIDDTPAETKQSLNFEEATKEFQKELIAKALKNTGGNKEKAARKLGLGRSTLFRHISAMNT